MVEADSTAAEAAFMAVEVSMVAEEVTMVTAADIPTAVTMAVATTVDTAAMAGMAATDGMEDIGAIHTTVGVLGGRIGAGDGDTRMATTVTVHGITLPTLIITPRIALRATRVLPTGTTTLRLRIPVQNPGATPGSLRDRP